MDLLTWLRHEWDRAGAGVAIAAGGIALVLGWVGVSGTGITAEQIPYVVSGGLGGLFLLGLGAMLWLSADMRDEWRVLEEIRAAAAPPAKDEDGDEAEATPLDVEAVANGHPRRQPLKARS
jgi:hypothetical protein